MPTYSPMSLRFQILLILLVLLPVTKLPLSNVQLLARPSDLLVLAFFPIITTFLIDSKRKGISSLNYVIVAFLIYSICSIFYGNRYLETLNLSRFVSGTETLSYRSVAFKRVLLLLICFVLFNFVSNSASKSFINTTRLLRFWFYGLCFAIFFHIFSYLFGENSTVYRGGIFLEGNHAGSYYLLTFFLMLCAKELKIKLANYGIGISLLGVLLSQSSISILILFFLGILKLWSTFKWGRTFSIKYLRNLFLIIVVGFVFYSIFGDVLLEKLFSEDINPATFSRLDRLATIAAGYDMFLDHPVFGVGIQGYGFALSNYSGDFLSSVLQISDGRRIPNNIYIELLSELGIIGFVLFSTMLFFISKNAFKSQCKINNIKYVFLSILLSWLAFPTYAVSFHWVAFGILHALSRSGFDLPSRFRLPMVT